MSTVIRLIFTLSELTTGPPGHPPRCCSHLLQTPAALSYSISGLLSQSPLYYLRSVKQSAKWKSDCWNVNCRNQLFHIAKKIHIDSALPDERHSYQSDRVIWFDHATIEKITFQMIGPTCSSQLLYSYCFSDVCFNFYFVLSIFWLP